MMELSPGIAVKMARDIYGVQTKAGMTAFLMKPQFSRSPGNKAGLTAQTGGYLLCRKDDSFGICAMGGKGYENDMFLIFRGTNSQKSADIITDARIGLEPSTTGLPVHIGFNQALKSMLEDIKLFIHQHEKNVKTYHVIGHSLGGAVAMLMADWLKSNKSGSVKVYTFGAPKIGLLMFNANFTRKMKRENIYRAYHPTDPVPMIPLFPYLHAPFPGYGHYVQNQENTIAVASHSIELYVESVGKLAWSGLVTKPPVYAIEDMIAQWLRSTIPVSESTPKIWEWLSSALIFVLKKITGLTLVGIQGLLIVGHSFADKVAYILRKGIELYEAASLWVQWLMDKIMQVLNRKRLQKKEELTRELMRNALQQIIHKTNEEARKAILRN